MDAAKNPLLKMPCTVVPINPSIAERILQCQHIIDSIVLFASRPTQVACLRMQRFHLAAARALYHTVNIDGDNMESFFLGSLIGSGIHEVIDCDFLNGGDDCNNDPKDKGNTESMPAFKKSKTENGSNHADVEKIQDFADDVPMPSPASTEAVSVSVPTTTNFKAPLFKFVRVLSIGSHHQCLCGLYGPHISNLFSALDVLRIVPETVAPHRLAMTCDKKHVPCRFFTALEPRKIVLRNLDSNGAPVPTCREDCWLASTTEEAVFFFPTAGIAYKQYDDNWNIMGMLSLSVLFPHVSKIKIVFGEWELWHEDELDISSDSAPRGGVQLDNILYPLTHITQKPNAQCTIYGLETLEFITGGGLWDAYCSFFPSESASGATLRDAARHELRCGTLFLSKLDPQVEYENDAPERIEYGTLEDYMADVASRRAEVSCTD